MPSLRSIAGNKIMAAAVSARRAASRHLSRGALSVCRCLKSATQAADSRTLRPYVRRGKTGPGLHGARASARAPALGISAPRPANSCRPRNTVQTTSATPWAGGTSTARPSLSVCSSRSMKPMASVATPLRKLYDGVRLEGSDAGGKGLGACLIDGSGIGISDGKCQELAAGRFEPLQGSRSAPGNCGREVRRRSIPRPDSHSEDLTKAFVSGSCVAPSAYSAMSRL